MKFYLSSDECQENHEGVEDRLKGWKREKRERERLEAFLSRLTSL